MLFRYKRFPAGCATLKQVYCTCVFSYNSMDLSTHETTDNVYLESFNKNNRQLNQCSQTAELDEEISTVSKQNVITDCHNKEPSQWYPQQIR